MLGDQKIIGFLATTNAINARVFYEGQLGLEFVSQDDYAICFDIQGIALRIQIVEKFNPQPLTALGWQVASIEETVGRLTAAGVVFERYGALQQDPLGIWQSPSGAKIAWFKDPDSNVLSLSQY